VQPDQARALHVDRLNSGVPAPQAAERTGKSVEVVLALGGSSRLPRHQRASLRSATEGGYGRGQLAARRDDIAPTAATAAAASGSTAATARAPPTPSGAAGYTRLCTEDRTNGPEVRAVAPCGA
jgi:hypothetical protein